MQKLVFAIVTFSLLSLISPAAHAVTCPQNLTASGGDDTSAINNAITSCTGVTLAAGTYHVSCTGISLGAAGRIFGAGSGSTTITTTCTNSPMVTHGAGGTPGVIGVRLTRSVTAVSGGNGIDAGSSVAGAFYYNDVEVDHQYIGINEVGSVFAALINSKLHDNVSHGFYDAPTNANLNLQIEIDNVVSHNNGGWGFYFHGKASSLTPMGDYIAMETYSNTSGGVLVDGDACDARIALGNFHGDTGDEFQLNTTCGNPNLFTDSIFNGSTSGAGLHVPTGNAGDVTIANESTSYGASSNYLSGVRFDSGGTLIIKGGTFSSNGTGGVAGNKFGITADGATGQRVVVDGVTAQSNQTYNIVVDGGVAMSVSNSTVTPATMVYCIATTCNYTVAQGSGNN